MLFMWKLQFSNKKIKFLCVLDRLCFYTHPKDRKQDELIDGEQCHLEKGHNK